MALLSTESIAAGLRSLSNWRYDGSAIVRVVQYKDFVDAIGFVTRVALIAQAADHHPDIDIRWNTVKLSFATHSEGGITAKDLEMAEAVDAIA